MLWEHKWIFRYVCFFVCNIFPFIQKKRQNSIASFISSQTHMCLKNLTRTSKKCFYLHIRITIICNRDDTTCTNDIRLLRMYRMQQSHTLQLGVKKNIKIELRETIWWQIEIGYRIMHCSCIGCYRLTCSKYEIALQHALFLIDLEWEQKWYSCCSQLIKFYRGMWVCCLWCGVVVAFSFCWMMIS